MPTLSPQKVLPTFVRNKSWVVTAKCALAATIKSVLLACKCKLCSDTEIFAAAAPNFRQWPPVVDESTGHLTEAALELKQFPINCMFIASLAKGKWHETLITISRVPKTKRRTYRSSGWCGSRCSRCEGLSARQCDLRLCQSSDVHRVNNSQCRWTVSVKNKVLGTAVYVPLFQVWTRQLQRYRRTVYLS